MKTPYHHIPTGKKLHPLGGGKARSRRSGFTLIEVVMAMGLIALLIGGVYAVARGALQISNKVLTNQQKSTLTHSFIELCRKNFESIPGNARVELNSDNSTGVFTTELVFTDYPLAFTWSGVPAGSAEVIMFSEKESRGSLQVKLQYLTEEEAEDRRNSIAPGNLGTGLVLLTNVKLLQWRFYDPRTEEWETEWTNNNRRPSLIELNLEFFDSIEPVRAVFWVPTMVSPEEIVRQANSADPRQGSGRGGPELPTDPTSRQRELDRRRSQPRSQ